RHFSVIQGVVALIKGRPVDIAEVDHVVKQVLILQGRIKAGVERRPSATWPVALRTIGIDPGAHPVLDRNAGIGDRDRLEEIRDVRLIRRWVEETHMRKGAYLVISPTGRGGGEVSIQLMGFYPHDIVCYAG